MRKNKKKYFRSLSIWIRITKSYNIQYNLEPCSGHQMLRFLSLINELLQILYSRKTFYGIFLSVNTIELDYGTFLHEAGEYQLFYVSKCSKISIRERKFPIRFIFISLATQKWRKSFRAISNKQFVSCDR